MKSREVPDWHTYFMELAHSIAKRSKLLASQHGAVIVNSGNRIIATGYNGAPAGFPDDMIDWTPGMTGTGSDWTIHAEENALLYAGQRASEGATMYVTGRPCPRCLLRIIQCGIIRVVCGEATYPSSADDAETFARIVALSGIRVRYHNLPRE